MYTPTRSTSKISGSRTALHHTPKTGFQTTPSPKCNPFEGDLEHLKHAIVTPGVFQRTTDSTPDSKGKPFQWDIEQKARLNPVDFGDLTEKLEHQERQSRQVDKQAQDHIDIFFQNEQIAPSPFGQPALKFSVLDVIEENSKPGTRNVSSQTDVHIPLSVDFNELLKGYKLSESQIDELNKGDSFSNSSLRRKLFGNESSDSSGLNSGVATPEKNYPPVISHSCWNTPSIDLPSSSPVFGHSSGDGEFITTRRCSFTDRSDRSSPDVSPISSPTSTGLLTTHSGFKPSLPETMQDHRSGSHARSKLREFHLSNSGLMSDEEEGDDGIQMTKTDQSMTVTGPQSVSVSLIRSETTMQQDILNDTASMHSVAEGPIYMDALPQTFQSFAGRSASDTGYHSQITFSTNNDTHVSSMDSVIHPTKKTQLCGGNMSPPKSLQNGAWEPPSFSTPRKLHTAGEDTNSELHPMAQHPL